MIDAALIRTAGTEAPTDPAACDDQRIDLPGLMSHAQLVGIHLATAESVAVVLVALGRLDSPAGDVIQVQSAAAWAQGFMAGVWAARREAEAM